MSNFLDDYVSQVGADKVLKTQFGIIDKTTGEHLVPVKNAGVYFGGGLQPITSKPNQPAVEVVVVPTLKFTTNLPATKTVATGAALTLGVVATGGVAPLKYEWKRGATVVGTNSKDFSVPTAAAINAGSYTVKVTDAASTVITSATCVVTVTPE